MEFFTQFGIVGTFLLNNFAADESRLVITVISGNNKVNTPVDTYNITDVGDAAFFHIVGYRYVKIILSVLINKFGSTKLIDCMVKVFRHSSSKIRQFYTTIQRIH